jgi:hypothetical protein
MIHYICLGHFRTENGCVVYGLAPTTWFPGYPLTTKEISLSDYFSFWESRGYSQENLNSYPVHWKDGIQMLDADALRHCSPDFTESILEFIRSSKCDILWCQAPRLMTVDEFISCMKPLPSVR